MNYTRTGNGGSRNPRKGLETAMTGNSLFRTVLGLAVAALLAAGTARAQNAGSTTTATATTQTNVGVVDMSRLLKEYKKRIAKYDELQKKVDQLQTDIDAMSKNIEALKAKYEKDRATMSEDDRTALKNQIETEYDKYQAEMKSRQRTVDNQEETVLMEVIGDVEKAIAQVAEQKNYHLILNCTKGPRGAVLYYATGIEITSAVLELLNK